MFTFTDGENFFIGLCSGRMMFQGMHVGYIQPPRLESAETSVLFLGAKTNLGCGVFGEMCDMELIDSRSGEVRRGRVKDG